MFSFKTAFSTGWSSLVKHWRIWLIISLVSSLAFVPVILYSVQARPIAGDYFWQFPSFILTILFTPALTRLALNAARGETVEFATLFQNFQFVWPMLLYMILFMLAITFGLIALIIPGFYLAAKYLFGAYAIVDEEKLALMPAMKRSAELSKGNILNILAMLFLVGGAFIVVSVVGQIVTAVFTANNSTASIILEFINQVIVNAVSYGFASVVVASVYLQLTAVWRAKPAVDTNESATELSA